MVEKVRLAHMSWQEIGELIQRKPQPVAIFPLGSSEEHGPHSPTGDFMICDELAERVCQETGAVMAPTLPFGYSEAYRAYPGTLTLSAGVLSDVVREIVYCLLDQGFQRVVLFNGHKGNEPFLSNLVRQIRHERKVIVPYVAPLGFSGTKEMRKELYGDTPLGHGGEPMGSFYTYLFPGLVDLNRAADWGVSEFMGLKTNGLNHIMFEGEMVGVPINMNDITPASGSMSDPRHASAERGEKLVANGVKNLSAFVRWFAEVDPTVKS